MRIGLKSILVLLASATLAVACGPEGSDGLTHDSVVELGAFAPYVAEFQAKGATRGVSIEINDLIIKFGKMTSPLERGYCELSTNHTPLIVVDQNYWNSASEGSRK